MKKTLVVIALGASFLASACNRLDTTSKALVEGPSKTESPKIGRFQMLQFERTLASGAKTPSVLRMDTTSGETWLLDRHADSMKWVSVGDNLQAVGTYNPATGKVESGIQAPDGRDLRQLSTEELIRLLSASSATLATEAKGIITTPDGLKWRREGDILVPANRPPGDPLGIRQDTFIKPGGALEKLLKESQKENSQKK